MSGEIFVSTDVEADGPIPGPNSMLSLASAAFTADGALVGTWEANLLPLEGAQADRETLEWFQSKQAAAYAATQVNRRDAAEAMRDYLAWIKALPGKPVFVGYPASYDFMFVHWYLTRFTGERPFSHAALDIKSYAMAMLKKDSFRSVVKGSFPKRWIPDDMPHTHVALDDAKEQGMIFIKMLRENLGD